MVHVWFTPVALCAVIFFLAMNTETTARALLALLAMAVALASVWLLGGRQGFLSPYMMDHVGRLIVAALSGLIVGRFIWWRRTGERMF